MTPSPSISQCHKYWIDGRSHACSLVVTLQPIGIWPVSTLRKIIVPDYVRGHHKHRMIGLSLMDLSGPRSLSPRRQQGPGHALTRTSVNWHGLRPNCRTFVAVAIPCRPLLRFLV